MMMKLVKRQEGFTLVELLIVIVIIGILAAIAVPRLATIRRSAWTSTCSSNRGTIENAAEAYIFDVPAQTYATIESAGLVAELFAQNYLKAESVCPASKTSTVYHIDTSGNVTCDNDSNGGNLHD